MAGPRSAPAAVDDVVVDLTDVVVDRGTTRALDGVRLRVHRGQRVALVGPSGAGKTTLLSVVNTSLAQTSGSVEVLGARPGDLSAKQLRALRARIATVPQGLHLPGSLKVVHNVNAGRLAEWSTARSVLSLISPRGTHQVRSVLAEFGIEHTVRRRTDSLSGGERQRVALARMVVQDADLVLADEPVASLDPVRAHDVVSSLVAAAGRSGHRPRALLVTLHDFGLAVKHFDRIVGLRCRRHRLRSPLRRGGRLGGPHPLRGGATMTTSSRRRP